MPRVHDSSRALIDQAVALGKIDRECGDALMASINKQTMPFVAHIYPFGVMFEEVLDPSVVSNYAFWYDSQEPSKRARKVKDAKAPVLEDAVSDGGAGDTGAAGDSDA